MDRNARNWQMILSKLAGSQKDKIKKEQKKEALAQRQL
jgi:hypothetical protein